MKNTILALTMVAIATPALANGLGEERSWQFRSAAQTAVQLQMLDMMEANKGGFYDQWKNPITQNYTIECQSGSQGCGNLGSAGVVNGGQSNSSNTAIGNQNVVNVGRNGSINGTLTVNPNQTNNNSNQSAQGNNINGRGFSINNGQNTYWPGLN